MKETPFMDECHGDARSAALRLDIESRRDWQDLLCRLVALAGAESAMLAVMLDPEESEFIPVAIQRGPHEDFHRNVMSLARREGAVRRAIRRLRAKSVMHCLSEDDLGALDLVRPDGRAVSEFLSAVGISHFAVIPIWKSPRFSVFIGAARGHDRGAMSQVERQSLAGIASMCREAVAVGRALGAERARRAAGSFSGLPVAAFVVDAFGELLAANNEGDRLLAEGDVFRVIDGELTCAGEEQTQILRAAVTQSRAAQLCSSAIPAMRYGDPETYRLAAMQLQPADAGHIGFAPRTLIVVRPPPRNARLSEVNDGNSETLTRAEMAVAEQLLQGKRMSEIARLRNVSLETIRSQVKAIYAKLNVHNHVEMMTAPCRSPPSPAIPRGARYRRAAVSVAPLRQFSGPASRFRGYGSGASSF